MANTNRGLGKGLDAIFGEEAPRLESSDSLYLPISKVESCAAQPRKNFDDESLADLADSIREHGIIQPLTVRRLASGYYQIIAGERRWRAARMAGLTQVPAVVIEADDRKAMELALIENLQREDLDPIEEAEGYRVLINTYHMTQESVAETVSKSRPAIANALRLLALPDDVRELLRGGKLSVGHARALLPLTPTQCSMAAQNVVAQGLNVRQTEAMVKRIVMEQDKPDSEAYCDPEEAERRLHTQIMEEQLTATLGRGVKIVGGRRKGHITLDYYDLDDLNDLLEALATLQLDGEEEVEG